MRYADEKDKANGIVDLTSWTVEESEQLLAAFETAFLSRGTERPITRPKDADEQKVCYSAMKKRHTIKSVVLADHPRTVHCTPHPLAITSS
jgi:hypothetical protein